MKKYDEILKEIGGVVKEIRGLREELEKEKNYTTADTIRFKIEHLTLKVNILKSNAKIALFNETAPVVLEVLKKYEGKRLGEKTNEKIRNEIKKLTGYITVIKKDSVRVMSSNYDVEFGTRYRNGERKYILVDNVIQDVPFEEFEIWHDSMEYVEDVAGRISDLKIAHMEAREKQKELEIACSKFNDLAVGDIPALSMYKNIYSSIL